MKIWNDEEVKNLFSEAENCKKERKSLKFAFQKHAEKYGRKPNSVRNYYYFDVENLKKDKNRCKKLGIDISKHEKSQYVAFGKEAEEKLLLQVRQMTKQGMSVRNACEKISGGDLCLMTRLQNKIQNIKRKNLQKDNVILFKQRKNTLTENDINSLFMGLVKLIKKTTTEEIEERVKIEKISTDNLLKKAVFDLGEKDRMIEKLKDEFKTLKNENKKLSDRLNKYLLNKKKTKQALIGE